MVKVTRRNLMGIRIPRVTAKNRVLPTGVCPWDLFTPHYLQRKGRQCPARQWQLSPCGPFALVPPYAPWHPRGTGSHWIPMAPLARLSGPTINRLTGALLWPVPYARLATRGNTFQALRRAVALGNAYLYATALLTVGLCSKKADR